jgi:hypothetical protein
MVVISFFLDIKLLLCDKEIRSLVVDNTALELNVGIKACCLEQLLDSCFSVPCKIVKFLLFSISANKRALIIYLFFSA